jgi:Skp family chaperone for outer membrane proteins
MKDKLLPWFLLFCALGLSGTAAYYSVVGLSIVFVGVALPVIIMGGFLEVSKLAIATYLHDKWKETYGVLKIYLTLALITLSLITSLGIYGLLSTGFSTNIAKLEIGQKEVKNIEVKKQRFEEIKNEYQKEKQTLDTDISNLRNALSTNTTTQSVDRQTGQVVTRANNANRKSFETQLQLAIENRDKMSGKVDNLNDSITALDIQILNMESEEISGNELGTIKYISEMTGWGVKKTANIFILILIFVFDPLAITLVIATNQAFKNNRKDEEDDSLKQKVTPQVTPQVTHELPHELPHELTHQVEEEVNVPDSLLDITEPMVEETPEEIISNNTEETQTITNRRLSYTKNDTGNFKINRI